MICGELRATRLNQLELLFSIEVSIVRKLPVSCSAGASSVLPKGAIYPGLVNGWGKVYYEPHPPIKFHNRAAITFFYFTKLL